MKCEKIQKEVFFKNTTDETVATHLLKCDECRGIAESLERFISAKPDVESYKIPKRIDNHITSEARAFIDERNSPVAAGDQNQYINPFHKWASVFAYAACFILVAWMLVITFSDLNRTTLKEAGNSSAKTSAMLDQEIKQWDNLDMGEDLFVLNTEIEINFATLSFYNEDEEAIDSEQQGFFIKIPDLM